jgi:phosphatidylglycerol:prolipoprotein diacylglycerol transferase
MRSDVASSARSFDSMLTRGSYLDRSTSLPLLSASMALPYFTMPSVAGLQPYGLCVFLGVAAGAATAVRQGRRSGISATDLAIVIPCALAAAVIGGHVFDVVAYQREVASTDSAVWFQMARGHSLFGALFAIAAVTALIATARRIHLAVLADVVALGVLVAMVFGRIGCALVHDHPGIPTDSFLGVDFPSDVLRWTGIDAPPGSTVRVHDVGLEDLLVLLPITIAAFVLARRRLNAGMVAAIVSIAYAVPRFFLDFLRLPATEPVHAGLTTGQWCCIVTIGLAAIALRHIAAKARRSALPAAVAAS